MENDAEAFISLTFFFAFLAPKSDLFQLFWCVLLFTLERGPDQQFPKVTSIGSLGSKQKGPAEQVAPKMSSLKIRRF